MLEPARTARACVTLQALRSLQAVAVLHRGRALAYGDLDAQATQLARYLLPKAWPGAAHCFGIGGPDPCIADHDSHFSEPMLKLSMGRC